MMGQKTLFSSKSDEWETPQWLFDELNREFKFVIDLAATRENKKTCHFINDIDNIEDFDPGPYFSSYAWCNPPYSNQRKFIEFSIKHKLNTVFLLPARTDTKLFHDFIYNKPNVEIRFIKGRLKFSGAKFNAPFPSMVVIFKHIN